MYKGDCISPSTSMDIAEGSSVNHDRVDRMASSRIAEQGKEKGVTGLKNLGNTCYMNAVIQCLCSTVPLVEYFFSWQFENLIARDRKDFANAFAKLLAELWFGEAQSVVEPKEFWLAVCQIHPPFSRKNQHDAQELLIYVLDELHHNLTSTASRRASDAVGGSSNHTGRKVSDSPISNLLQGVLRQRKICLECGKTSQKDDIFTVLSLPIPLGKEASLYDCLQCFFQQVMLTWRDKIFCSYCKAKHDATIEVQIRKPPKILMLHLKRFEFRGGVKKKLKTNVTFPLENLDMSPFLSTYYVQYPKYNLYSVVNHSGELEFGHYTAYCKNPRTKAWNAFDDMKHFRIAEDTVQSPLAYILFYTSQEFSLPNETSSSI
ncbi:ubiquitin carboxyl-terminal hydrolase 50 isoform X2 [Hyperolius riggenbachi]|uniref:ubiquitin carboxyl-terminal hydrolase 50 isoform X2 n=1 Tax=Hyperolius riggenbachi TaxID=752182 RepID=UPI0035A2E237